MSLANEQPRETWRCIRNNGRADRIAQRSFIWETWNSWQDYLDECLRYGLSARMFCARACI